MKFNQFLILAFGVFLMLACKKDGCTDKNASNYDSEADTDDGSCVYEATFNSFINLSMTGDESGEFSSDANTGLSGSPNNGYDFIISRGPDDAISNQSFSIYLITRYIDVPSLPISTGSYDLIPEEDLQDGDGNFAVQCSTNNEMYGNDVSGTLNITESNNDFVKGDFNFTTTNFTNGEKEVVVTGTFQAPTSY